MREKVIQVRDYSTCFKLPPPIYDEINILLHQCEIISVGTKEHHDVDREDGAGEGQPK